MNHEEIVIDPEAGVGTAGLSLPFRVCAESDGQRFKMVEAVGVGYYTRLS